MKKIIVFLFITGLFFASQTLFAQTPLTFGSTASGFINEGSEVWYSVRPSQNGFAVFETIADFDSYLEFYDAQYNLITYDDDSGEGMNARLVERLSAGTYFLEVRRYSDSVGSITVHAAN